jgi:tol-pal system-associated acyl-CoA thioesterase
MSDLHLIDTKATYSLPIRVYIEDTDAGGIVFYANYLKFFERARTEFIRSKGFQLRAGFESNVSYVVHSLEIKYLKPARLDDLVFATACVEKVARTYLQFSQQVMNEDGECLVEGRVKVACVTLDTAKPRVLPAELIQQLTT